MSNSGANFEAISGAAEKLNKIPVHATITSGATLVAGEVTPVNAEAGEIVVVLPTGKPLGTLIAVEKTDSSTNIVKIEGTIRGEATSDSLKLRRETVLFEAESTSSWRPISDRKTLGSLDARYEAKIAETVSGLVGHENVYLATAAALPTNTYLSGVITGTALGALTIDGTATPVGKRITVKNEVNEANNGIYTVTHAGGVAEAYVLTRATDMNTGGGVEKAYAFVEKGTKNKNAGFFVSALGPFTIGTTAITWSRLPGTGDLKEGTAIEIAGNKISAKLGRGSEEALKGTNIVVTDEKIWLSEIGIEADNTDTNYCDEAFKKAREKAETYLRYGQTGRVIISGPAGVYKINQFSSTAFPAGITFGGFGGGSTKSARFYIPTETNKPAAIGVSKEITAINATSVKVKNVKNEFASASSEHPQPFWFGKNLIGYYTGVTGSGEEVTLTGVTGITESVSAGSGIVANYGIILGGKTRQGPSLDKTIEIVGPKSGSSSWEVETPPTAMDGIFVPGSTEIDCAITGFRMGVGIMGDHEKFGPNFSPTQCYAFVCLESPSKYEYASVDSGNQFFDPAIEYKEAYWCAFYITAGNFFITARWGGAQRTMGFQPWAFWKEKTEGVTNSTPTALNYCSFYDLQFEGNGLGVYGCPDGRAILENSALYNCNTSWDGTPPSGKEPVATFAMNMNQAKVAGGNMFPAAPVAYPNTPIFDADYVIGETDSRIENLSTRAQFCTIPGHVGPFYAFRYNGGLITGMSETTKAGDVVVNKEEPNSSFSPAVNLGRATSTAFSVAGVATTVGTKKVGGVRTNAKNGEVTVNVLEQATPPTAPSAEKNETAGTLEAKTYYAKIVGVSAKSGLSAASSEVSVTAEASKSIKFKWTKPAEQHSQAWSHFRVYIGTASGVEKGYVEFGAVTEGTWSGAALTGTTEPPTINKGCEIWRESLVRSNGATATATACSASGLGDTTGQIFGWCQFGADNGITATIFISPTLS